MFYKKSTRIDDAGWMGDAAETEFSVADSDVY